MNKRPILDVKLVSVGQIVPRLHYGEYSREWWIMRGNINPEEGALLYPIRVGWQTVIEQNNRCFYMHITEGNENNEILPGYRCHSGSKFSDIETAPSYAITSLYQRIYPDSKTKFSGPFVLGWDNNEFLEVSLKDDRWENFGIYYKYKRWRTKNTIENYTASFIDNDPIIFFGSTPTETWKNVGFYKKYRGTQLFGLEHSMTQKAIHAQQIPTCSPTFWNNETLMNNLFEKEDN
ncbi:hypothetical protein RhiirA4_486726 [Rhizophagus irregularis]|uniref:Uncharacterized protein n=1 Tax=Rhizophagus irregularis TaxID=588596 RepID=A0A2I1HRS3_9GLOM|nr:hypothetical protein RhiirA4_486726 [Rhizophagus irregularis]